MKDNKAILERMKRARAGLLLDQPFFGSIALRLTLKEDTTCETAYTDGITLGYNPEFIDSLTLDETKGLLAHEVLHVANAHHLRRNERDKDTWNIACDYAINGLLLDSGFVIPKDGMIPSEKGKSAEEYYSNMPKKTPNQSQNGQSGNGQGQGQSGQSSQSQSSGQSGQLGQAGNPGNFGEVRDYPSPSGQGQASQAEIKQAIADTKVMVSQAAKIAKSWGKLPSNLAREIEEILRPIVPWKEVLARFVDEVSKNDYCWTKPNTRYAGTGFFLPSLHDEELGNIAVAVDTSGSIDVGQLNRFASELTSIASEYQCKIVVYYVDSIFQGKQEFNAGDKIDLRPIGGGGTDYRPAFEEIEKDKINPTCMIYFTDGYCRYFPDNAPSYPVLWLLSKRNRGFKAKFGETIEMV